MKELSIEEKARRYDKAIEIAKDINNEQRAQPFNVMTRVFPELKESEDEWARKEMLEYCYKRMNNEFPSITIHQVKRWLTWLEKQGEQPKKHDVCDNCDQQGSCVSPCPMKLIEKQGEQKSEEVYNLHNYLYGKQKSADKVEPSFDEAQGTPIIKQDAQKPVGFNIGDEITVNGQICRVVAVDKPDDTREYDFHGIKFIPKFKDGDVIRDKKRGETTTIRDFSYDTGLYTHTYGQFPITIQDDYEKIKPIAWSEEDEMMIKFALTYFRKAGATEDSDIIKWLKSLKNRVQPQPKQEWSEEDEIHQLHAISLIEDIKDWANKDGMHSLCIERCIESIDWLKFLRERYTWKPSREQLEALKNQCINTKSAETGAFLCNLYYDLKKL